MAQNIDGSCTDRSFIGHKSRYMLSKMIREYMCSVMRSKISVEVPGTTDAHRGLEEIIIHELPQALKDARSASTLFDIPSRSMSLEVTNTPRVAKKRIG